MEIRYNHIRRNSLVDGPGSRTVLFMQGCDIHCPGCQNHKLWDPKTGRSAEVAELAEAIANVTPNGQVTISGGEPFLQPAALAELCHVLKQHYGFHVIVYSGHTWEQLRSLNFSGNWYDVMCAISNTDVLVDGPFVRALDDDNITYRGSRNQRPINVQASRKAGKVITYDWDSPEVVIGEDGDFVLPIGLSELGSEIGTAVETRICGQTATLKEGHQ
jgi:anaerobic ribonucleoside-triphosphate reductase activating protein